MKKHEIDEIYLHTSEQAVNTIDAHSERFYVYALVNPLNNTPFYVGKGSGYRCTTHFSLRDKKTSGKNKLLRKLSKLNREPLYFFYGFYKSEKLSYHYEDKLISKYGLKTHEGLLYNIYVKSSKSSRAIKNRSFIDKSNEIHKNKYDYSKTEYLGYSKPLILTCDTHGDFTQLARVHLRGAGCPECGYEKRAKRAKAKAQSDFVNTSKSVHKGKYDYSKTLYIDSRTKLSIICPKHGAFSQLPFSHKSGSGCPKCNLESKRKSIKDVIKEFDVIHDSKYNYSKVMYLNNRCKVIITCRKHGDFLQSPYKHLSGNGCPYCSGNKLFINKHDY